MWLLVIGLFHYFFLTMLGIITAFIELHLGSIYIIFINILFWWGTLSLVCLTWYKTLWTSLLWIFLLILLCTLTCVTSGSMRLLFLEESLSISWSILFLQDVCYSMPLCHFKMEEIATDDLIEVSEHDKHISGQV